MVTKSRSPEQETRQQFLNDRKKGDHDSLISKISNHSPASLFRCQKEIGLIDIVIYCFLASVIIFPNTFRLEKAVAAIAIIIFAIFNARLSRVQIFALLAGLVISGFYLIVGLFRGADDLVVYYVMLVYLISPIFWVLLSSVLLHRYGVKKLEKFLIILGFLAACTVPAFWVVFANGGGDSLSIFIEDPNVYISDSGVVSIRMHVYGSLIFLVPAFFAYMAFKKINFKRAFVAALLLFTTLISGRSALIFSTILGLVVWCSLKIRYHRMSNISWKGIVISLVFILLIYFLIPAFNISFLQAFHDFQEKILDFGGDERKDQFNALLEGIEDTYLFGKGHGIPSYVIRNDEMPWKYELLLLANIFHVGLLGSLVYVFPLFYVLCKAVSGLWHRFRMEKVAMDMFFLSGMLSITFASATNPYLLSAEFHWMWFLPFVYFSTGALRRKKID